MPDVAPPKPPPVSLKLKNFLGKAAAPSRPGVRAELNDLPHCFKGPPKNAPEHYAEYQKAPQEYAKRFDANESAYQGWMEAKQRAKLLHPCPEEEAKPPKVPIPYKPKGEADRKSVV